MAYNSKYTGEQVEELLDAVSDLQTEVGNISSVLDSINGESV